MAEPVASTTLVSIVAVKDDLEVTGPAVRNRLAVGFDRVVVVMVEPSAAMRALAPALERIGAEGAVRVVVMERLDAADDFLSFAAEPMRTILAETRPDWLLISDADEFVLTARPDLHTLPELAGEEPLNLPRYNYARQRGESSAAMLERLAARTAVPLVAEREHAVVDGRLDPARRWSEHRISPRPIFRPRAAVRFDVGAHRLVGADGTLRKAVMAKGLLLAHLPFTTYERFARKVENVRAHLADLPEVHARTAAHWKHWVECLEAGRLEDEFAREAYAADEFAARTAGGAIALPDALFARLAAGDRRVR
ncbi:hypothetical protein [Acuticoccus sp. I52.16.1]|uniref:hypothetical protein n=1 Tax=Acuticoccus sp. I52.16.1 TaxID=2928472 RepID=UPI001FD5834B|nr:hypothetical protein [Acuticoccus sp. I52.16.1]UOM37306.1 hypothetical protein MRB58_24685 [Acuticoccus sp. I52.16.1]